MDQKKHGRQNPLIKPHCEFFSLLILQTRGVSYIIRWYNIPVESSTSANPVTSAIPTEGAAEIDSQPINFDTFVPTHNPSLDHLSSSLAPPMDHATIVSQDEAFSRALNAMYWGGYWTAMYHARILHTPLIIIYLFSPSVPTKNERFFCRR